MRRLAMIGVALAVAASLAIPRSDIKAWGDNGHITVAKIADLNLTTKAKAEIVKLLGPGVNIYDRKIAMFADNFKFTTTGSFTRSWHFVDIPVNAAKYDASRDCASNDCVVFRIEDVRKTLTDTTQPKDRRVFALKMLVHLVGDVHQPLHAAARDNKDGDSDHGGNKVPVHFLNRREGRLNLHHVWDDEILNENMQGADPEDYGATLNDKITDAKRTDWSSAMSAEEWANESHLEAKTFAYQGVPPIEMIDPRNPFDLDQSYYEKAAPIVDTQLSKAGVRLAKLLNEALK
jgi:S1/P1 Nuclease